MTTPRLPDFIIAGAPRSATTWLYQLADRHPEIAMAKPVQPEPKFFLVDELYVRGLAYYAATWFDPLPERRILGEKSTNYLESPWVAARIHADLPAVRLIFLLRNPVDRAYSNYLWTQRNGFETETFARALQLEDPRDHALPAALRYARPFAYFSRGLYADLLARFLRLFPRHQILVLRTEDIAADPEQVALRLQRFLGVAEVQGLSQGLGTINVSVPDGAPPLPADLRRELEDRYRGPNQRLHALLGDDFPMW
jgi:hypothetical protein